jgi:hypothetical protein
MNWFWRLLGGPLPKFCRQCGCPMEAGESPWQPKFDPRTGLASRRVDYWWCPNRSDENHWNAYHDAIHLRRRTVPAPEIEGCKP